MTMLRSLSSTPGVITLFHSTRSPAVQLFKTLLLESHPTAPSNQEGIATSKARSLWSYISQGKQEPELLEKYNVEDIKDQLPTYDQLKLIKSFVTDDVSQMRVFQQVFPDFVNEHNKITIPEELETLALRNETFTQLSQEGVYNPPLIVDWDKGHLANSEKSLQRLLKVYMSED